MHPSVSGVVGRERPDRRAKKVQGNDKARDHVDPTHTHQLFVDHSVESPTLRLWKRELVDLYARDRVKSMDLGPYRTWSAGSTRTEGV